MIRTNHLTIGEGCLIFGIIGTKSFDTIPPNHIGYSNLFYDVGKNKLNSGFHFTPFEIYQNFTINI